MTFPAAQRVTFERNSLVEVLSQLRFPTLLEIEAELPVSFHKAIRGDYPIFRAGRLVALELSDNEDQPPEAKQSRTFEFSAQDEKWKVVLASNFLALTTTSYSKWEEFSARLETLIDVLLDCYGVSQFQRIGLRYKNVIDREALGLDATDWCELLSPAIAGVLSSEALLDKGSVIGAGGTFIARLSGNGKVRVEHGLVDRPELSQVYVIDSDFFIEEPTKASKDAAATALSSFRPHTGDFFQWCITPRLYEAMRPQAVT